MNFELGPEERAFEAEVEAFLREHASPERPGIHDYVARRGLGLPPCY